MHSRRVSRLAFVVMAGYNPRPLQGGGRFYGVRPANSFIELRGIYASVYRDNLWS